MDRNNVACMAHDGPKLARPGTMIGPGLGPPWAHDGPPWAHDGPTLGPPSIIRSFRIFRIIRIILYNFICRAPKN
jgi:hypothetical protein